MALLKMSWRYQVSFSYIVKYPRYIRHKELFCYWIDCWGKANDHLPSHLCQPPYVMHNAYIFYKDTCAYMNWQERVPVFVRIKEEVAFTCQHVTYTCPEWRYQYLIRPNRQSCNLTNNICLHRYNKGVQFWYKGVVLESLCP